MSLLKNVLAKNYIGDIYEASYGFFCSVADEIEFVNPNKLSHAEKFRLADKYDVRNLSVPDIDNYFKKYLKYNRYDIMGELELENPFIKDVIDVYANEKKIYATLVMNLKLDKTHGLICLFDGYIKSYNQLYLIKENTILIDREHIKNFGIGSYRFNVLHEIVHFEYHKYYLTLKRQLAGIPYVVIDKEATLKNIEDQANKVASLLLVPSDELSKMLIDNYMKYDFYFAENKNDILIKISNSLSKYFNCSKTCMNQRIKAIGFYTADIDTQAYSRTYKAKYFDSDEFFAHRRGRYYSYKTISEHKKLVKRA